MDGVLWSDETPIGDLEKIFKQIQLFQLRYGFATNNSTKAPTDYKNKLNRFLVPAEETQIITSGTAIVNLLKEKHPQGGPVYILGEEGLRKSLQNAGFYHRKDNVLAVVGGLDRKVTYEKLKQATLLLQSNVDFFFTNIDPAFPTPQGKIPGAGSLLRSLEAGSKKKAILAGKPLPMMFEYLMKDLSAQPENTLVIGDRMETDILGGLNAHCLTALVLTGISKKADLHHYSYQPHMVFDDLSTLVDQLSSQNWEISR